MIRVITIDDESLALKLLEVYIGRIPDLQLLRSFSSADEAVGKIQDADALFIDIDMPGISGMEFVKGLSKPPLIVFTTAYTEYAIEGYKVNAVDYLLKPFTFQDFKLAVDRLRDRLNLVGNASEQDEEGIMFFKTDYRTTKVKIRDILYIEGLGEYIRIHLKGESTPLVTLYRMKCILEELPVQQFVRIHKSYIVNIGQIQKAAKQSVVLSDGTMLQVGDVYKKDYLENINTISGSQ